MLEGLRKFQEFSPVTVFGGWSSYSSELEGSEEPVNLTNNKLSDVIEGMDQYLRDKPEWMLQVFLSLPKKEPFFDAIKVAVAIGNLVDNAFKYAGNFSKVTISTTYSDDGSSITCAVSDDGNGIPGWFGTHFWTVLCGGQRKIPKKEELDWG